MRLAGALIGVFVGLGGQRIAAQSMITSRPQSRSVDGRVFRGTAKGQFPVASQVVVLHRIASDSAGPLDSVLTSRDGRFRFRYSPVGDEAMYIVSTRYDGVAYFTAPLRGEAVSGDDAALVVFDTTSGPVPLVVRGRHIVLAAPGADRARHVVDVFEIANDTSVTRVPGSSGSASWSIALPPAARAPQVGQGDLPASAVRFEHGRAEVFAPFSPGLKQLVLSYELPPGAFPVSVPSVGASVLEVLLEEDGAAVQGVALANRESVTLEERRYRRFLGQEVPAAAVLRLTVPPIPASRTLLPTLLVGSAAAMLALGFVFGRRGRHRLPVTVTRHAVPAETAESVASAIAALDNVYERRRDRTPEVTAAYEGRRAELKARLQTLLPDVESGTGAT